MTQRTLAIIKPDAVANGAAGRIIARIEAGGFKILAAKLVHMSLDDAAGFYAVHRERPFFESLCTFMTQGPCIPMVLEADAKASAGTIRKEFASSIEANAVHGSDGPETAATEIAYFFSALEIHPR
jgi:nucleoside-diphosphate kinase